MNTFNERYQQLPDNIKEKIAELGLIAMDRFSLKSDLTDQYNQLQSQILQQQQQQQQQLIELNLAKQQIQQLQQDLSIAKQALQANTCVSSSLKGKQLEDLTEHTLIDLFPDAVITRTTHIGHQGDFHIQFGNVLVMVECKNYNSTVDQREIDKFENDLQQVNAQIGLMISLGSNIKGKRRVEIEKQGSRLIGFVVCSQDCDLLGIGIMIRSMLQTQSIFSSVQNQDQFVNYSRQLFTSATDFNKEVQKYVNYNTKHVKATKDLSKQLQDICKVLSNSDILK